MNLFGLEGMFNKPYSEIYGPVLGFSKLHPQRKVCGTVIIWFFYLRGWLPVWTVTIFKPYSLCSLHGGNVSPYQQVYTLGMWIKVRNKQTLRELNKLMWAYWDTKVYDNPEISNRTWSGEPGCQYSIKVNKTVAWTPWVPPHGRLQYRSKRLLLLIQVGRKRHLYPGYFDYSHMIHVLIDHFLPHLLCVFL